MTVGGGHRLATSDPGLLDPVLERLAQRAAEIVVGEVEVMIRRHLERVRTQVAEAAWLTQGEAAALAGVGRSTIRAWQRAGRLSRGARARVRRAELEQLLGGSTPAPAGPLNLERERARRAAVEILAGRRGGRP